MKKDIIYIDIEDDITTIIGKVKVAENKIVALVPPKRTGVLQSVVNLKLLKKSASETGKQIVLITSDHSLLSLASGLKIPVAKNLQSKPEVAPIPALELDGEDVINGVDLPVGELDHALGQPTRAEEPTVADEISQHVDLRDTTIPPPDEAQPPRGKKPVGAEKKVRVPDFSSFRKRLFIFGGVAVVFGAFLFWAVKIAPRATVVIAARTSSVPIERTLGLDPKLSASDTRQLQLKPTVQQVKKSVSTDFDATGTKDTGNKATGTVTLTYTFDSNSVTVPAGTVFTAASGQKFASMAAVTVPGATVAGGGVKPGTATVQVQASDIGPEFNVSAQAYTVTGYPNINASGTATSGGTRDKVTIVTQDDVNKAKDSLPAPDVNAIKADLRKQFGSDLQVIDESFTADAGDPTPTPNVGETAKRGRLTVETTYSLSAVSRADLKQVLADTLKSTLDNKPNQSVFDDGSGTVQFQLYQKMTGGTAVVHMTTTGYIGTTINAKDLANQFAGKRYGDIEQIANQIPGVNKVDIKFSPFWVNQAPGNPSKIDIKFSILNDH